MYGCDRLLGMRYRLGADGTDGEIDCIHLCYAVLSQLQIPAPAFDLRWYDAPARTILKAINGWGDRISEPSYDGDILLYPDAETGWAFAVVWQSGILHINRARMQVHWLPLRSVGKSRCYRYSPMSGS